MLIMFPHMYISDVVSRVQSINFQQIRLIMSQRLKVSLLSNQETKLRFSYAAKFISGLANYIQNQSSLYFLHHEFNLCQMSHIA